MDDGLSQNTINSIFKDDKGFLWFATQDGLNRYDGYEFLKFKGNLGDSLALSHSVVNEVNQDNQGNFWIATYGGGVCKYDPKKEIFTRYMYADDGQGKNRNYSYTVYIDSKNRIWSGNWEGLDIYDPKSNTFKKVLDPFKEYQKYNFGIQDIVEDNNGNLWLATHNSGLITFNTSTMEIDRHFNYGLVAKDSLEIKGIVDLEFADNGFLLFSSGQKLWSLDSFSLQPPKMVDLGCDEACFGEDEVRLIKLKKELYIATLNGEIKKYHSRYNRFLASNEWYLPKNTHVKTVMQDSSGSLWIATKGRGVLYLCATQKHFNFIPSINSTKDNSILDQTYNKVLEDHNGNLWFFDYNSGLTKYDYKSGKETYFNPFSQGMGTTLSNLAVKNIIVDKNNVLWFATHNFGLLRFDPQTNALKMYESLLKDTPAKENKLNYLLESSDGLIWIGFDTGFLACFDPQKEEVTSIYKNLKVYPGQQSGSDYFPTLPGYYVHVLYEDNHGDLYVGFHDEGLFKLDRKKNEFTKVEYRPSDIYSYQNCVRSIVKSTDDDIWVGTGGGLFKYNIKNGQTQGYTTYNGLLNHHINDILVDDSKNLWLTTNNGLSKLDTGSGEIMNFGDKDGLQQSEYNFQSSLYSKKLGRVFLGGIDGYNHFDPQSVTVNTKIPPIVITSFKIYGKAGEFKKLTGINYRQSIELEYGNTDFSIEISALDYTNPEENQYAYWLEGYNEGWIEMGHDREITFTNLRPGNYHLKLKGSNNDGIWNEKGKILTIGIQPPWWRTWWAKSLWVSLGLTLVYFFYQNRKSHLIEIKNREISLMRTKIFTNITHEFRTPLTLITGINEELKDYFKGEKKYLFDSIDRNSRNLLNLVNQLLDLRKSELGHLRIDLVHGDITKVIKDIFESFQYYARTKGIQLHFIDSEESVEMDFDTHKLWSIISNLLSNAIKFTPKDGNVYLQIINENNRFQIQVMDTGTGIQESELPYIFDYYYTKDKNHRAKPVGFGIGLALTKEFVHALDGTIEVKSKFGKGTTFVILLPIRHTAKKLVHGLGQDVEFNDGYENNPSDLEFFAENELEFDESKLNLLIIEDNFDIVNYLILCLKTSWNISVAGDGGQGINKALDIIPDIILCDIMMPKIEGYEVLTVLKEDERTSHIPIVLLSAKSDEASRIEGYRKGADAYLMKPFNKSELTVVLKKLVDLRQNLQERYKKDSFISSGNDEKFDKEDNFLYRFEQFVMSNTSETYSITDLCSDMGMSRSQMHNKIKALTGYSTSNYARKVRLTKGKYLLKSTDKSISEIAYEIGFNSPSYFTRAFKELYGFSPKEFKEKIL